MPTMTVSQLLQNNKDYSRSHAPYPLFSDLPNIGLEPRHIVVLTCADPRCEPIHYLKTVPTDMVVIMRNVCGHVNHNVLKDIVALDSLVGITDVIVIHHTDCGALMLKDENIKAHIMKTHDSEEVFSMRFQGITDLEQSVRDDLDLFTSSLLVRAELKAHAIGFVYDLKTGALSPVKTVKH